MARKLFTLSLNRSLPHNIIHIKPKVDLGVVQIKTIMPDGSYFVLLDNPVQIDSPISIRYNTIVSSRILIEIENTYVEELNLEDLVSVEVSLAEYHSMGKFVSEDQSMNFHEYLILAHEIENVKDVYIKGTLGIKVLDKYKNILYSEMIPVSLNDDGWLVEHSTGGKNIELPVQPSEVKIIVEGSYTEEFSIDNKTVLFDAPDGMNTYIIYKPFYSNDGVFAKINDNVSINSNGEILLRNDKSELILYNLEIEIYNTDITSTNHTPIIKSLALVATDQ